MCENMSHNEKGKVELCCDKCSANIQLRTKNIETGRKKKILERGKSRGDTKKQGNILENK